MKPSYLPGEGFRVRLMSPLGRYPAESLYCGSAALIISPDICFSVTHLGRYSGWASEVDPLTPAEIPLFGSVVLGEAGHPYLYPYPVDAMTFKLPSFAGSINEAIAMDCKSHLVEFIQREHQREYRDAVFAIHKPPLLGGRPYDLVEKLNKTNFEKMFSKLQKSDRVTQRGVNCLLKARMAFLHPEFGEAGCIYLWIALDAAHSLVLEGLRNKGIQNPSSKDAARYFDEWLGDETEWEKFFEDDYENRIRAIHPANRLEAESIPQFMADDFYDLNDLLIPFFHSLVLAAPALP
jgi:hypothetical protein